MKPILAHRQLGPKREYLFDGDYEWLNEEPEPSWIKSLARILFVSAMILFATCAFIQVDHWISKQIEVSEVPTPKAGEPK